MPTAPLDRRAATSLDTLAVIVAGMNAILVTPALDKALAVANLPTRDVGRSMEPSVLGSSFRRLGRAADAEFSPCSP